MEHLSWRWVQGLSLSNKEAEPLEGRASGILGLLNLGGRLGR